MTAVTITADVKKYEKQFGAAKARVNKLIKTNISQAIDVEMMLKQIQGHPAFKVASQSAGIVVSTLFPITDVIEDVIEVYRAPSQLENWMFLAIDVLCFVPITALFGRSLKFAMHTVKPAMKSGKSLSKACEQAIINIVSTETIGAIEKAIENILGKVEALKSQIISQINKIIDSLISTIDNLLKSIGLQGAKQSLKGAQQTQKKLDNYTLASPFKAENWKNLGEAVGLKGEQAGQVAAAAAKVSPAGLAVAAGGGAVWSSIRPQLVSLKAKVNKWITSAFGKVGDKKGVLAILSKLLQLLKGKKGKTKPATVDPKKPTQANNKKPSTQATRTRTEEKAKGNADPCACDVKSKGSSKTKKSITFALGTEMFSHVDFELPFAELLGARTYSSNLAKLDQGIMGARWITPFNQSLSQSNGEWNYLKADGRNLKFPIIPVKHSYTYPIENIEFQYIDEETIVLKNSLHTEEIYQKQGDSYQLKLIENIAGQRYELYYDHIEQGQAYLSDIIVKSKTTPIHHVQVELTAQHKIKSYWLMADNKRSRKLAEYSYDKQGDLIEAKNEYGYSYQYSYQYHLITRYTDLTGRGVNLKWDGKEYDAKAIHEWDDEGASESKLKWDDHIRLTTVTDAVGNSTDYYYTENGYTYRTIYPNGLEEWLVRDAKEQVQQHIHANGESTLYDYDERGNILKMTNADQQEHYYAYDENNNLTHYRDAEGNIWQKEYDDKSNLVLEVDPLQRRTQYQYNDMGLPVSIEDAKGGIKTIKYNGTGQITEYTDCSGKKIQWRYDERGRLIEVENALGEKTQYQYKTTSTPDHVVANQRLPSNAYGQLDKIIHADETEEWFIHDAEGRLLAHIDAHQQITQYQYDRAGRIIKRTEANNSTLTYHWDRLDRLVKLSNENGSNYRFHYNVLGQLLSEIDFDGKETKYTYNDRTGELHSSVELDKALGKEHHPRHRIQHFEFDGMGRLLKRTAGFSDNLEQLYATPKEKELEAEDYSEEEHFTQKLQHALSEEFAYDGNGQLIQVKNADSRVQHFYDEVGNISHEHHHDHKHQRTAVWKHSYDELNNRITTLRPDGQRIDWLLYGSGHSYGMSLNRKDLISYKRDDLHREIERHYANGLSQLQKYNKIGELLSQGIQRGHEAGYPTTQPTPSHGQAPSNSHAQSQQLLKRVYKYNRIGQLMQIQDSKRGQSQYFYDSIGRLIESVTPQGKERFSFDPAHNIQNSEHNNAHGYNVYQNTNSTQGYAKTHKLIDNVVKDYYNEKYQYDSYGQLTQQHASKGSHYLEWDAFGRLIRSKSHQSTTHYRYDGLGRRIEKHKRTGNNGYSQTTIYGWDGDTLAYESTHQYTKHYIYDKDSFIPLMQASYNNSIRQHQTPEWNNGYDYSRDPLWHEEKQAPEFTRMWYYHCDHLGTPQEMSNETGEIVWSGHYKAWGECKEEKTSRFIFENTEIITNNIRFQGQYYDEETGLHYNRHRYYSPYVGRFISKDPIGLLGGLNAYAYAPNPIQWIDPLGLNSTILNAQLGGRVGDKMQAHHVIPVEVWNRNSGFFNAIGMDGQRDLAANGVLMPDSCSKARSMKRKFYHCGSHAIYSDQVDLSLNKIKEKFNNGTLNTQQARNKVAELQNAQRAYLKQSSTTSDRLK